MTRQTAASPSAPLRVLVAGVSWPMETFVERLLTGLADEGAQITIRSRHRPSTTWLHRTGSAWEQGHGALDRAALRAQVQNNGYIDAARAGFADLRARRSGVASRGLAPHVVYVPWLTALMADPGLFDLGAPVVTSCRGSLVTIAPWDPNRPDYRADLERVFARSALVHCVSAAILDEAEALGLTRSKARVIHPAVDPGAFKPVSRQAAHGGPVKVIGVGNLIWVKDYEHALVAMRRALDSGVDLTLDLVGDGPEAQHLRYTIDDLNLGDRVTLLGRLPPDEVNLVLGGADVFLHTSSVEGMSNAVLEAMATGLAVITTDAGGMREAVRDGVDGLVVPVRGTEEIASALFSLAQSADLRRQLGASARERVVAEFRLDQQIASFQNLLVEAAATRTPR